MLRTPAPLIGTLGVISMMDEVLEAQDQLLRKIGRNVVNFHRLEANLRALILMTRTGGTISDYQLGRANHPELLGR